MEAEKMVYRTIPRVHQNRGLTTNEGRPLCCNDTLEVKGGFRTLDGEPSVHGCPREHTAERGLHGSQQARSPRDHSRKPCRYWFRLMPRQTFFLLQFDVALNEVLTR